MCWFSSVKVLLITWNSSLLLSVFFLPLLYVHRKIWAAYFGPKIYSFDVLSIDISPWSPDKCTLIIELWVSGHFIDVEDDKRIYWNEMKCVCQRYQLWENAKKKIYIYIDVRHKVILLIIMVPAFLLFSLWAYTWIYSHYTITLLYYIWLHHSINLHKVTHPYM